LLGQDIKSSLVGPNEVRLKEAAISGDTGSLGAAATEIQAVKTIVKSITSEAAYAAVDLLKSLAEKLLNGSEK